MKGSFDNGVSWDRVPDAPENPEDWANPVTPPMSTEDLSGRYVDGVPGCLQAKEARMDRLSRIAGRVAAGNDLGFDEIAMAAAKWFSENPNPADSKYHAWAKEQGWEPEDAEAAAYRLASAFATFVFAGRAAEKGVSSKDVDPTELSMGISVEMEHTTCRLIAERIALDHLAELKDYYTRLKAMEAEAGVED